jgi:hypothetical protein
VWQNGDGKNSKGTKTRIACKARAHVPPGSEEDGSVWGSEDDDVPDPEEKVEENVVSLRLDDVPGNEEELEGDGVVTLLLLEVGGGTVVVLDEWGALVVVVVLLLVGVTVVEVVLSAGLEVVVASVVVCVSLTLTVVELSSRFASCTADVARGSSACLVAGNLSGKYRWRSSSLWQGNRGEPATANPKSTRVHNSPRRTARRTYASLLVDTGRCRLSGVDGVPEAAFSWATTGRRASDEGEWPPLRRSMAGDAALKRARWICRRQESGRYVVVSDPEWWWWW